MLVYTVLKKEWLFHRNFSIFERRLNRKRKETLSARKKPFHAMIIYLTTEHQDLVRS